MLSSSAEQVEIEIEIGWTFGGFDANLTGREKTESSLYISLIIEWLLGHHNIWRLHSHTQIPKV